VGTATIQPERVRSLNGASAAEGDYVLYWMQQSQRAETNHALEYAVRRANELGRPLVVAFGLTDDYPGANLRHYRFMLEGLAKTAAAIERRGIGFVCRRGSPPEVALELAARAALVVCDRGYLRHQKAWREAVAREAGRAVVEVEADVVVPVDVASGKREYAARTIRPKIHRQLDRFLVGLRTTPIENDRAPELDGLDLGGVERVLDSLDLDRSVGPVTPFFEGGTAQARAHLGRFLDEHLRRYGEGVPRPHACDDVSRLSPYLHFGQISPVHVALEAREAARARPELRERVDAFLEQLVVRRELAVNFVHHAADDYDAFGALPDWARSTLNEHAGDAREAIYTREELERGETHDETWNAAMREMRATGWLHNHLRMYWGKRILAWTESPEQAFQVALDLNDRWFLDGRDPNGYANVAWLFGLHDRAWQERDVYGKVRIMTRSGLDRKIDVEAYLARVDALEDQAGD